MRQGGMNRRRQMIAVLAMAALPAVINRRAAATKYYVGGPSNIWSSTSSWSTTSGGASGAPVPTTGDVVNITNSMGASQVLSYNVTGLGITLSAVTIDATGGSTSTENDTLSLYLPNSTLLTNAAMTVGNNGVGTFNQTAGTTNVSNSSSLTVGFGANSIGYYTLGTAGSNNSTGILLVSGSEAIGWNGTGRFNQNSGSHTIGGILQLGLASTGNGLYTMNSGMLLDTGGDSNGNAEYIGEAGVGTFVQTGGTHTVGNSQTARSLDIGYSGAAIGTYIMNGSSATLTVYGNEIDGDGATGLGVGSATGGTFNQSAGTHQVVGDLILSNQQVGEGAYFLGGTGTLTAGSLDVGKNGYGVFIQTAGAAIVGGTLNVGTNASGNGGYLLGTAGGSGSLTVNGNEFIGNQGVGEFGQYSGTNTLNGSSSALYLGCGSYNSGTYFIEGGTLKINSAGDASHTSEYVGYSEVGAFQQDGGTNITGPTGSANNLDIGVQNGAYGYYTLTNNSGPSVLTVTGNEIIGDSAATSAYGPGGNFEQDGGTHTIGGNLVLGRNGGSTGTFLMTGGSLTLTSSNLSNNNITVGNGGTGTFNQTGGTVNVGGEIDIGYGSTGAGSYTLSNTSGPSILTAGAEVVGYNNPNVAGQSALFFQIGGSNSPTNLDLGLYPSTDGLFILNGGTLSVSNQEEIGASGTGSFQQSGGSNVVGISTQNAALLSISSGSGETSTYTINDPTAMLTVYGAAEVGGNNTSLGAGVFDISAGSVTISGALSIQNSAGTAVNLTGGKLSLGSLILNGGTSQFNWTGGTLSFSVTTTIDSNFVFGPSVTLSNSQILASSVSLTNNGAITLAGGGVGGPGLITNNGLLTGYGNINSSGGFINNSELQQSGGNIALYDNGNGISYSNIDLAPGRSFILGNSSTTLLNGGTINLNGGTFNSGAGVLNDGNSTVAGTVAGRGSITGLGSGSFVVGALGNLTAQGGTLNVSNSFSSGGVVQSLAGATLSGGTLTNSGTVQGNGTITNAIANGGTIQATDGALNILGVVTNGTAGLLTAATGNELDLRGGLASGNLGTIRLAGGTIFVGNGLTNSTPGSILGYGVLTSSSITNQSSILLAGGSSTVNGPLNNSNGATVLVQNASALFTGLVTNSGTFRVTTGGAATFAANYSGGAVSQAVSTSGTFVSTNTLIGEGNFTNSGATTLGGNQTWIPGTSFTNTAGTATFNTDAGANGQNLAVNLSGGSLAFTSTQHFAALSIGTGTTAALSGAGNRSILYTQALSTAGTLDLTSNDLDFQVGGASGLSAITALVKQGFNAAGGAQWNGTGITSSSAAADSTHLTALGVIASIGTTLDGLPVAVGDVLAKYTYYGDTNLDGKVDASDYSRIDSGYVSHATGWFNGDFNYDGVINGSDYTLIDNAFNTQGAELTAEIAVPTTETAVVPEPALLLPLTIGNALLLSRRRGKRRWGLKR